MNNYNKYSIIKNKINILYKEKCITESQKSKLLSVKWDRNICAHPASKKELRIIKDDSDAIIRLAMNLINIFESKLVKFEKSKKKKV